MSSARSESFPDVSSLGGSTAAPRGPDKAAQERCLRHVPELFDQIAVQDWAELDVQKVHSALELGKLNASEAASDEDRLDFNARNDKLDRGLAEKELEASRAARVVNPELELILLTGLQARVGARLVDEPDLNTYLQLRSRWPEKATRW